LPQLIATDRRRRTFLQRMGRAIVGLRALTGSLAGVSASFAPALIARAPEKMRPQTGDELVHAYGDLQYEPVSITSVTVDGPPLLALPRDPTSGLVRDGSRLNQVVVLKLSGNEVSSKTARYAAGDVIVYSAVCTHTGCTVEKWNPDQHRLICPCHSSEFEPRDAAKVVSGPAPKPLAMLPVVAKNDRLVVSGKFSRRVGMQPPL
jgi:rieske iron-sulfur protein